MTLRRSARAEDEVVVEFDCYRCGHQTVQVVSLLLGDEADHDKSETDAKRVRQEDHYVVECQCRRGDELDDRLVDESRQSRPHLSGRPQTITFRDDHKHTVTVTLPLHPPTSDSIIDGAERAVNNETGQPFIRFSRCFVGPCVVEMGGETQEARDVTVWTATRGSLAHPTAVEWTGRDGKTQTFAWRRFVFS